MAQIYAVVPAASEKARKLCRGGFEYSGFDRIDRGDGYAILKRVVQDQNAGRLLEILEKAHITAWQRPADFGNCIAVFQKAEMAR